LNLNAVEITPVLYEAYWNAFIKKMQLYDGTMELLACLRERDIKIGICSDLTARIQFRKLMRLGLSNIVNAVVTSEECGREKPSEDMFKLVLDKLQVLPCDSIMIGDSLEKDVLGAKKAGMKAVLYGSCDNSEVCVFSFNELREELDAILE
jgi:putative hydrolase of the HAD superfamily